MEKHSSMGAEFVVQQLNTVGPLEEYAHVHGQPPATATSREELVAARWWRFCPGPLPSPAKGSPRVLASGRAMLQWRAGLLASGPRGRRAWLHSEPDRRAPAVLAESRAAAWCAQRRIASGGATSSAIVLRRCYAPRRRYDVVAAAHVCLASDDAVVRSASISQRDRFGTTTEGWAAHVCGGRTLLVYWRVLAGGRGGLRLPNMGCEGTHARWKRQGRTCGFRHAHADSHRATVLRAKLART